MILGPKQAPPQNDDRAVSSAVSNVPLGLPNHSTYGSEPAEKKRTLRLAAYYRHSLPTSCFLAPTNTVFVMGMEADSTYEVTLPLSQENPSRFLTRLCA